MEELNATLPLVRLLAQNIRERCFTDEERDHINSILDTRERRSRELSTFVSEQTELLETTVATSSKDIARREEILNKTFRCIEG